MKRSSRTRARILPLLLLAGLVPAAARAGEEDLNRLLSFKHLYVEPPKDNVDGAFRAPVEQSFKEIFEKNPRFELVTETGKADAWVRTTVEKKARGFDVEISLIVAPSGEIFSTDRRLIEASASGSETGSVIKQLLKTALKRIPFYGTVTGRDGPEVTMDIGLAHGLRVGDIVQISRVDSIKRHPLLKSIVDVQLVPVGDVLIESVEDSIAFGKVSAEIPGETIRRFHKVTAIEAREGAPKNERSDNGALGDPLSLIDEPEKDRPRIGFFGIGPRLGTFSSSSSNAQGTQSTAGSVFAPGFRATGELWFTKNFFADLLADFSFMSYSQTSTPSTGHADPSGVTSNARRLDFNVGYRYLVNRSIYGPQAYLKLGYSSFAWNTTTSAVDLMSSKSYSGLGLGVGGALPISSVDWGALLDIRVTLFPGLSEDGFQTGTNPSVTGAGFFLGGYHYMSLRLALRAGFDFQVQSATYPSSNASTGQKTMAFIPSLLYYF